MTTPTAPSPDDLLGGSIYKGRSISFGPQGGKPPVWHKGLVVNGPAQTVQQRNIAGELLWWKTDGTSGMTSDNTGDGNRVWNIVIPVMTTYRSQEIIDDEGEDTGQRYLWVRGSKKPESRSLWAAIAGAMRKAKTRKIEVGAATDVGYVAEKPVAGGKTAREYEATWVRPDHEVAPTAPDPTRNSSGGGGNRAAAPAGSQPDAGDDYNDEPPF
jgi:hypothetical protein